MQAVRDDAGDGFRAVQEMRARVQEKASTLKRLTEAQELLRMQLAGLGHHCVMEWAFCEGRRWRFDLFCHDLGIGFECDGGMFHGGHKRGKALEADYEKQNTAQIMGFRLLRFTNQQVLKGEALAWLKANL